MRLLAFCTAAVVGEASLGAGCAPSPTMSPQTADAPADVPDRTGLRPVALPDLSGMAESVQAQLRQRHSALQTKLDTGVPEAQLAEAYGDLGKLLLAAEYFDIAEACFLHARALMPEEMRWAYYLGQVYTRNSDPAKGAALFEEALALRPDDPVLLVSLGYAHLAAGQPASAEAPLARALSREPRSAAASAGLGRVALASRDYSRAVRMLEDALSVEPQASSLHYPLALAYRGLGDGGQADIHLKRRGSVEPARPDPMMREVDGLLESLPVYELRGTTAMGVGDWPAAVEAFRKGMELAPENPSIRHRLGTALMLAGDVSGAIAQFEEVVRRSPDFARAHLSLGVILESSGRRARALEELAAAVRDDPNYGEAHLRLAEVLRQSGRSAESLIHYERAVELDPYVAEARMGLATLLVAMKRYAAARDVVSRGVEIAPSQPGFAHALARLLSAAPDDRVRDGRRALVVAQELLTKAPASIDVKETMAMALAEARRFDEASSWQRDAISAARQAARADVAEGMAVNLTLFERQTPARVPWTDDAPFLATLID